MPIKVPRKVLEGIDAARNSGKMNMTDRNTVMCFCFYYDYYSAVHWIWKNKTDYYEGIFLGFEVEEADTVSEEANADISTPKPLG